MGFECVTPIRICNIKNVAPRFATAGESLRLRPRSFHPGDAKRDNLTPKAQAVAIDHLGRPDMDNAGRIRPTDGSCMTNRDDNGIQAKGNKRGAWNGYSAWPDL